MEVTADFPLSKVLWYKIGGKAKYFISVTSREDLLDGLAFLKEKNVSKIFICGLGSNLVFTDEYFDGGVIQIAHTENITFLSPNKIETFAGATLDSVIKKSFTHELLGLEWAGGLPGTVGAAIRGNVGAFGGEIEDTVDEVEVIDSETLEIKKMSRSELSFGYRSSRIKEEKKLIVISVTFQLRQGAKEELQKAKGVYHNNIDYRKSRHPLEYPNCGSVFKNITKKDEVEKMYVVWPDIRDLSETKWYRKISMGYSIKRLGFSGYSVGNAQVSEKHANFIVNLGGARASDVKIIINSIQNKFFETFGFTPEVEVEIVS